MWKLIIDIELHEKVFKKDKNNKFNIINSIEKLENNYSVSNKKENNENSKYHKNRALWRE